MINKQTIYKPSPCWNSTNSSSIRKVLLSGAVNGLYFTNVTFNNSPINISINLQAHVGHWSSWRRKENLLNKKQFIPLKLLCIKVSALIYVNYYHAVNLTNWSVLYFFHEIYCTFIISDHECFEFYLPVVCFFYILRFTQNSPNKPYKQRCHCNKRSQNVADPFFTIF